MSGRCPEDVDPPIPMAAQLHLSVCKHGRVWLELQDAHGQTFAACTLSEDIAFAAAKLTSDVAFHRVEEHMARHRKDN